MNSNSLSISGNVITLTTASDSTSVQALQAGSHTIPSSTITVNKPLTWQTPSISVEDRFVEAILDAIERNPQFAERLGQILASSIHGS